LGPRGWLILQLSGSFIALLFAFAVAGYAEPPEGAPASAQQRVTPTAHGLATLFERECFERRDLAWAQAESKRIVATCGGPLVGDGERGDCEQSIEGDVEWLVPTTDERTVLVRLIWFDQPQRVFCSLSTGPDLEGPLQQVAQSAAAARSLPLKMLEDYSPDLRTARDAMLILYAHSAGRFVDSPSFDTKGHWSGHFLAMERSHPHELLYWQPPAEAPTYGR
jgi:hypothetical protein